MDQHPAQPPSTPSPAPRITAATAKHGATAMPTAQMHMHQRFTTTTPSSPWSTPHDSSGSKISSKGRGIRMAGRSSSWGSSGDTGSSGPPTSFSASAATAPSLAAMQAQRQQQAGLGRTLTSFGSQSQHLQDHAMARQPRQEQQQQQGRGQLLFGAGTGQQAEPHHQQQGAQSAGTRWCLRVVEPAPRERQRQPHSDRQHQQNGRFATGMFGQDGDAGRRLRPTVAPRRNAKRDVESHMDTSQEDDYDEGERPSKMPSPYKPNPTLVFARTLELLRQGARAQTAKPKQQPLPAHPSPHACSAPNAVGTASSPRFTSMDTDPVHPNQQRAGQRQLPFAPHPPYTSTQSPQRHRQQHAPRQQQQQHAQQHYPQQQQQHHHHPQQQQQQQQDMADDSEEDTYPCRVCCHPNPVSRLLQCSFCDGPACAGCANACDGCHFHFCSLCCVANFDQQRDRYFCLSCLQQQR
ncbi:hypothetical protein PTSG_06123 [Salpingoeca rosetta]|uniref:Uncharacterized protein n=1 Tax=Salpingoeca rosetta (strain ATCC 50818 / BSB-021) TaxID=946362 RepID=F2UC06_SALR5|nr:uncharacterized protein PTSG_06123 [Salpingoeca rosetta]EGD74113.1 hypothetical protein PTSG_06123 [Salpingoeca rosetta]|eukprot:XP_004993014.1 hypothetical protein PTSG_06123 [Salpingoeca rosetta]